MLKFIYEGREYYYDYDEKNIYVYSWDEQFTPLFEVPRNSKSTPTKVYLRGTIQAFFMGIQTAITDIAKSIKEYNKGTLLNGVIRVHCNEQFRQI